jgi:hypothetical protein
MKLLKSKWAITTKIIVHTLNRVLPIVPLNWFENQAIKKG